MKEHVCAWVWVSMALCMRLYLSLAQLVLPWQLATGDISELGVPEGALCVGFSFPFADCNQEPDVSVHLSLSLIPNAVVHLVGFIC